MQYKTLIFIGMMSGGLMTSCVKPKIYKAELLTRQQAEAREKVLQQELTDRKKEAMTLVDQVGNLNRTIGNQERDLAQLRIEVAARSQQVGDVSSRLMTEKIALEKDLSEKNTLLNTRTDILQKVQSGQIQRSQALNKLAAAIVEAFKNETETKIDIQGETIELTLPDKLLFEPAGLNPSAKGRDLLTALSAILTERPALDIDLIAYTDNALPKGAKNIADTWDWSLQRATTLTRMLIRDFGVNANQLTPVGRGEFYPVATNETPEGRQQNRRTVVVFRPVLPVVPSASY